MQHLDHNDVFEMHLDLGHAASILDRIFSAASERADDSAADADIRHFCRRAVLDALSWGTDYVPSDSVAELLCEYEQNARDRWEMPRAFDA